MKRGRSVVRGLAVGATLATATLVIAGCGDDEGIAAPPPGEVRVVADPASDTETSRLTPTYRRGQQSTTSLQMSMGFDLAGQSANADVNMKMRQRVVRAVHGEATIEARIDSVDVSSASSTEVEDALDDLVGKTVIATYDQRGLQVGSTELKGGGTVPEELEEALNTTGTLAFPEESVGVGSKWVIGAEKEIAGTTIRVGTEYELTELTGDQYTLSVRQDQPLDGEVDGAEYDGNIVADGTIHGSLSNPLLADMTYDQDTDFEVSADGESADGSITIDLEMTSAQAA